MYRIPTILTPDEIMDKAFKKANKVQVKVKDKKQRYRKVAQAKVKSTSKTISSTLRRYIRAFPSFDNIPAFYYELFDVTVGVDAMRKSLGALDWCRKTTQKVAGEALKNMSGLRKRDSIKDQLSGAYGRFSSLLNQISSDLEFLGQARENLRLTPKIDAEKPTVVIAGAPNVGKSMLVGKISTAKPKIASYPFTTKGISVGNFESDMVIFQVIDTPGLLDREMEKRNEMEKKAILALRHLANVIVFIIDPSEYCGYSMESQLRILSDIKSKFKDIPIIEVENKVDITRLDTERIKISSLEGEGLEDLKEMIIVNIREIET
jgi:nucleolar GTP-binding protein